MRCLIVDDHKVLSAGLSMVIRAEFPGWDIEVAQTVKMAVDRIGGNFDRPVDLVLVDLMLPGESGFDLLKYVRETSLGNPVRTLVVTGVTDANKIQMSRDLGASGYIFKNEAAEYVITAINAILSGGEYYGDEVAIVDNSSNKILENLTDKQRDLVDLIINGYPNKKIADVLDLSYGTVKNYVFNLMRELKVKSRVDILVIARDSFYRARTIEEIKQKNHHL